MPGKEEGRDSAPKDSDKCARPLLCAEEWQEPEGHKIVAEFHRPGLTEEEADIETDLSSFEKYWREKSGINFMGEYHKPGAPYLEEPSAWEGHRPRAGEVPPNVIVDNMEVDEGIHLEERALIAEEDHGHAIAAEVHIEERIHAQEGAGTSGEGADDLVVPEKVFIEEVQIENPQVAVAKRPPNDLLQDERGASVQVPQEGAEKQGAIPLTSVQASPEPAKAPDLKPENAPPNEQDKTPLRISEFIDLSTIETMSYVIIRALWGKDIHVPVKKEGLVDMEVHIKGKDALINTNQFYFALPELVIWHIIYTHKGRPVLEIGRGVKNGMKLHYGGAIRLAMEFYLGNRKAIKAKKVADQELHKNLKEAEVHK